MSKTKSPKQTISLNSFFDFEYTNNFYFVDSRPLTIKNIDPFLNVFKSKPIAKLNRDEKKNIYYTRNGDLILAYKEGKVERFAFVSESLEGRPLSDDLACIGRIKNTDNIAFIWHFLKEDSIKMQIETLRLQHKNSERFQDLFKELMIPETDSLNYKQVVNFQKFVYELAVVSVIGKTPVNSLYRLSNYAAKVISRTCIEYYKITWRLNYLHFNRFRGSGKLEHITRKVLFFYDEKNKTPEVHFLIKSKFNEFHSFIDISSTNERNLNNYAIESGVCIIPISLIWHPEYRKKIYSVLSIGVKHLFVLKGYNKNDSEVTEIKSKLSYYFSEILPIINFAYVANIKEYYFKINSILSSKSSYKNMLTNTFYYLALLEVSQFKHKQTTTGTKSRLSTKDMQVFSRIKLYCYKKIYEANSMNQNIEILYTPQSQKDIVFYKLKVLEEEYFLHNNLQEEIWHNFMARSGNKKTGNNFSRTVEKYKKDIILYKEHLPNLYSYILKNKL